MAHGTTSEGSAQGTPEEIVVAPHIATFVALIVSGLPLAIAFGVIFVIAHPGPTADLFIVLIVLILLTSLTWLIRLKRHARMVLSAGQLRQIGVWRTRLIPLEGASVLHATVAMSSRSGPVSYWALLDAHHRVLVKLDRRAWDAEQLDAFCEQAGLRTVTADGVWNMWQANVEAPGLVPSWLVSPLRMYAWILLGMFVMFALVVAGVLISQS